jgi:hypothetical protein
MPPPPVKKRGAGSSEPQVAALLGSKIASRQLSSSHVKKGAAAGGVIAEAYSRGIFTEEGLTMAGDEAGDEAGGDVNGSKLRNAILQLRLSSFIHLQWASSYHRPIGVFFLIELSFFLKIIHTVEYLQT